MTTQALLLLFMLAVAAEHGEGVWNMEKRIFGGFDCPVGQGNRQGDRQFHVKLVDVDRNNNDELRCGGSLINRRWVLTAGHCANTQLILLLGVHDVPAAANAAADVVRQVIPENQQFVFHDGKHCRDIMLVRLNLDAPGTFPVVQLPPRGCTRPAMRAVIRVAGFGPYRWDCVQRRFVKEQDPNIPPNPNLQCADMDVAACGVYPYPTTAGNAFCYERANVDTCKGDSGGGVVFNHMIYGVHIMDARYYVCGTPAYASDVCHFRDWINKVLTTKNTYELPGRRPIGDPDYNPNRRGCC